MLQFGHLVKRDNIITRRHQLAMMKSHKPVSVHRLNLMCIPPWYSFRLLPCRGVTRGERGIIHRAANYYEGAEMSQQCHKYFLQYSTFASKRPQVQTLGHQTCFLPQAPSNLVAPLLHCFGESQGHLIPHTISKTLNFRNIYTSWSGLET